MAKARLIDWSINMYFSEVKGDTVTLRNDEDRRARATSAHLS